MAAEYVALVQQVLGEALKGQVPSTEVLKLLVSKVSAAGAASREDGART